MKYLVEAEDAGELVSISSLLESSGIPIHIKSVGSRLHRSNHIYVFYDAQYEDALALLANPSHEVENQINMGEFNALRDKLELDIILKGALKVLAVVIVAAIFVIYILYLYRDVA